MHIHTTVEQLKKSFKASPYYSVSDPGFFPRIRIRLFFLSPDPDRQKIRIRSGKIRIRTREKNVIKLGQKLKKNLYFISSTLTRSLNTVFFGQALPKPYQNHHLDHTSL